MVKILSFDGVYRTRELLQDIPKTCHPITGHVYKRIVAPITILLVLIDTVVTQVLRGLCFILSGLITMNLNAIKAGCIDLISAPIQAVVLPLIALVSLANPEWSSKICKKLLSASIRLKGREQNGIYCIQAQYLATSAVASFVVHLFAVPTSIVRNVTMTLIKLMHFKFKQTIYCAILTIKEIGVNFGFAFLFPVKEKHKYAFFSFTVNYLIDNSPSNELYSTTYAHTWSNKLQTS